MKIKTVFIFCCVLQSTCFCAQEPDLSAILSLFQNMDFSGENEQSNEKQAGLGDDFFNNLMSGLSEIQKQAQKESEQSKNDQNNGTELDPEKSKEVYEKFNNHIGKYFPKVYAVRDTFFLDMTPEDIAKSLENILEMLAFKPWMYVQHFCTQIESSMTEAEKQEWGANKYDFDALVSKFEKDGLNVRNVKLWLKRGGGFWEFISDQLALFHNFIKRCRIDTAKGTLFLEKDTWNDWFSYSKPKRRDSGKHIVTLKDYWTNNGITVHHDFYVLCFMYSSYLFLEGVRVKNLYAASRFYDEDLRPIMENLRGGSREADLRTYMERYKGVLDIFKAEERADWFDDEDDKYFNELYEFYDMD